MLKRLFWLLGVFVALALGVLLLAPFLISVDSAGGGESAKDVARAESHFIQMPFPGTSGIDLHYLQGGSEVLGSTPTFLLLHGFTFNAFTWNKVLPFFSRQGKVLAYDQIPYGLSTKLLPPDWSGPNPYTKEAAVIQLFAFMDALGIEEAILVGNSSGGTLAMEAALARPERVKGLILVAPWVFAQRPTLPSAVAELPQLRRLSLLIARKLGEGVLLDYSYFDPGRIDADRRVLMTLHSRVVNWDLAWGELLNRSLSNPVTVSAHLADLTLPTLLLTGDQDKLVPVQDTRRVAGSLPNASLAVLPGCGHIPQEECPEQFEQAVSNWMEQFPVGGNFPGSPSPLAGNLAEAYR